MNDKSAIHYHLHVQERQAPILSRIGAAMHEPFDPYILRFIRATHLEGPLEAIVIRLNRLLARFG